MYFSFLVVSVMCNAAMVPDLVYVYVHISTWVIRWCDWDRADVVRKMTDKNLASHNKSTLDMLSAKKLQKICFFIFLVTWLSLCLTNIYSSLDNVNTSLNIVTESLIPFKQALCMKYTDDTLYSTNGKFLVIRMSGRSY